MGVASRWTARRRLDPIPAPARARGSPSYAGIVDGQASRLPVRRASRLEATTGRKLQDVLFSPVEEVGDHDLASTRTRSR